jgi:aminopeptidase N
MIRPLLSRFLLAGVCLLALAACGPGKDAIGVNAPPVRLEVAPAGQLPAGVTPTAYRLTLVTDPAKDGFDGTVEIDVKLDSPHARIWLHALGQKILSARAKLEDGREITATFTGEQAEGGVARLDFETPVPAGDATLIIDYQAPYNFGLAGLYKVESDGKPYLATQMEAIDARRLVPSFDEPRFKTPWTLTVTAPKGMKVIANGAETAMQELEGGQVQHAFATTRPLQSYLIALAVGPYDVFEADAIGPATGRTEPIPLRGFAAAGKAGKLGPALDVTDDMLLWQENYFATPYPYGKLDLIAAPDFAYGAMENAGAIIYRESALLIDERTSLGQRRGIFTTHAHELGHQWFGNLVTPKWWNDIWLNEAFATWISYKTLNGIEPEANWSLRPIRGGLNAMSNDSLGSARQVRNPIASNGDINDAFDAITYQKGGSVLNMFEAFLGEDAFREGIRLHMRRFADGVADVDDFMQSLSEGSGKPEVVASFKSFILQPGIPMLDVQLTCSGAKSASLRVVQSRYAPLGSGIDAGASQWQVPFSARLINEGGSRTVTRMLTGRKTDIKLDSCPMAVMPNAGGTGYWRYTTDAKNAAALSAIYAKLSPGEQLVYGDALTSGFEAGRVSADDLLIGLAATAKGSADAAAQPLGDVAGLYNLLDPAGQQALRTWIGKTYGPRTEQLLSTGESSLSESDKLLRQALVDLGVRYGDRKADRASLLARAVEFVGKNGAGNAAALKPEEFSTAMIIGAEDGGRAFHDAALAFARTSKNQSERAAIYGSLARFGESAAVTELMTSALGGSFNDNERYTVFMAAMSNRKALPAVWPAFQRQFDAFIAGVPDIRTGQVAGAAGAFCSKTEAAAAKAFFEGKAAMMPGYERSLAQAVEAAELCGALKAALTR